MAKVSVYIGHNLSNGLYFASTVEASTWEQHHVEMPHDDYQTYRTTMNNFSEWQSRLAAIYEEARTPKMSEEEREERAELQRLLEKYPDVLD